jgi:hypothetical protein
MSPCLANLARTRSSKPGTAASSILPYCVGEGEADADALADPEPDASADALSAAEPDADALPEALGSTETLGVGLGLAGGKSVVGTFRKASTKMRMKITSTISTHGRASVSFWGGSAPR